MIHYDLRCGEGHTFDGWFRSSAAFEQQAEAGLLDCPFCASRTVARAIMAPRVQRGAAAPPRDAAGPADRMQAANTVSVADPPTLQPPAARALAPGGLAALPAEARAVLQRLRAEVEQRCEYVGSRFADEARAMHHGEQPRRSIYGETSPHQAEALAEEGIEIASIPWVPRAES